MLPGSCPHIFPETTRSMASRDPAQGGVTIRLGPDPRVIGARVFRRMRQKGPRLACGLSPFGEEVPEGFTKCKPITLCDIEHFNGPLTPIEIAGARPGIDPPHR